LTTAGGFMNAGRRRRVPKKNSSARYQDTLRSLKSNFGLSHSQAQAAYTKIRERLDRSPTASDIARAAGSRAAERARATGKLPPGPAIAPAGGRRQSGPIGGAAGGNVIPADRYREAVDDYDAYDYGDEWVLIDDPEEGS
jgi:hypothetical protein